MIGCSVVLFGALALGLRGTSFVPDGRDVRVRFHDVTGIRVSSPIKFAGVPAGRVTGARMLTAAERESDPYYLVELTLTLASGVPPLTNQAEVSIAADTLLSDKFVLVKDAGNGAPLAAGEVLAGITPATFDALVRNLNDVLGGFRNLQGGEASARVGNLLTRVNELVDSTQVLVTGLQPAGQATGQLLADAREAIADTRASIADARTLVTANRGRIEHSLTQLDAAATSVNALAKRSESLVQDNAKNLSAAIAGLRTSSDNLKITTTYSRILFRDLSERPTRLIWGRGRPPEFPDPGIILKSPHPVLEWDGR